MSIAHSRFGASGAHRWIECPASISMEADYPDQDSIYAAEGTLAHEVAEACLRSGRDSASLAGAWVVDGEHLEISEEMGDYVQVYLDYVRALPGHLYIEQRVDYSHVVPEGFGTADALVYDDETRTLYVVDLKYGMGVRVDAEENPQGMLYAIGAISHLSWLGDVKRVVIVIVQPRLDHISEWETTTGHLEVFGVGAARAALDALSPTPTFNPGEKQCRFCKASGNCQAQADYNLATARAEFAEDEDELQPVHTLDGARLAWVLDRLKALQDWTKAVESRATSVIDAGGEIPGYKLVEGRSLRQWSDERDAETALQAELGDEAFTRKIISPAQAEKALGTKHPLIAEWVVKPPGKPTLVPESDKRPAIRSSAERDFS
jgi:hypothetical protein